MTRGQKIALLIGIVLPAVTHASCARVQSRYVLPQVAVSDAAFPPTLEAYTPLARNRGVVDRLLEMLSFPVRSDL